MYQLVKCTQFPVSALWASFHIGCDHFQQISEPRWWLTRSVSISDLFVQKFISFADKPKKYYLLINGNKVDIRIFIRRKKYQSISWITNSSSSSTAVNKGTNDEKNVSFYMRTLKAHSIVFKKIVLQISLNSSCKPKEKFSYLAELGGSYCITQWIFGMSTPRPITSVHTSTPL